MLNFFVWLANPLMQPVDNVVITSPRQGDVIQGVVTIVGSSRVNAFMRAELSFAYLSNPNDNWFTIVESETPVIDAPFIAWDTTGITDGDYALRLRVFSTDGSFIEEIIQPLYIRNDYLPPTTPLATPNSAVTATVSAPSILDDLQTATPMPANSMEVTEHDILQTLKFAAFTVAGIFLLLGIYFSVRHLSRR